MIDTTSAEKITSAKLLEEFPVGTVRGEGECRVVGEALDGDGIPAR